MNDLNKEIEKIKMVTNEDKESSEVDIVELREAVVELWERQEAFIEVHDENVEFMNEMKEIQNIIIDYLN
jgi:1-aminocyclopropane-1-carboxylate deaminase/D-cysteine desulfhydrase-like pyridoxal-dependent ACC family enzyme